MAKANVKSVEEYVASQPILVTGAHRSGTTWVGRIVASSPSVAYIHEPFHIHHDPCVCAARFDCWFTYVCEENESQYYEPIRNMLDDARTRAGGARGRTARVRPLIKDPLAVFSAAWLSSRFKTRNVVMIRHPAAFAGSLKEKNWTHPFSHFLCQPLLMTHHLTPFTEDILRFAREERDIVDQAALLWKVIHFMILRYQEIFPDWIYLRHEDLSRNPMEEFRSLFDKLELQLSEETERAIAAHSFAQASTTPHPAHDAHGLKRDSLANIDTWKKRLTGDEIERLKSQVWDLSRQFYAEHEW